MLAAGLLSLRTLVFKLMSVTCSMAGGLIAGKEGPFVHTGGIVGGGWAGMGSRTLTMTLNKLRWYRKPVKVPRKYGGYFRNDADHRDFVSIGTAAGEQLVAHCGRCVCGDSPAEAQRLFSALLRCQMLFKRACALMLAQDGRDAAQVTCCMLYI